jgi:CHAT domain-containing protein/tetratricopeptide (TPR) repeat protein
LQSEVDLANRLERATSVELQKRLLAEDSELVTRSLNRVLITRAHDRNRVGEHDRALASSRAAERVADALGDAGRRANAIITQGYSQLLAGRLTEAEADLERGIKLADDEHSASALSYGLNVKAALKRRFDVNPEAIDLYRRSIQVAEANKLDSLAANAHKNLGVCLKDLGDLAGALDEFVKALHSAEASGDKLEVAAALNNTATVYLLMEELAIALDYSTRALRIHEELKDAAGLAIARGNLGSIYRRQGQLTTALEYYQQALAAFTDMHDVAHAANAMRNIGLVHQQRRDFIRAQEYYEKSLAACEQIGRDRGTVTALLDLVGIQRLKGNDKDALSLAERAVSMAAGFGDPILSFLALQAKGNTLRRLGAKRDAVAAFTDAAAKLDGSMVSVAGGETQSQRFFEHQASAYVSAAEILFEAGDLERAFEWTERCKARTLLDILPAGRAQISTGMTPEERAEEQKLRQAMVELSSRTRRPQTRQASASSGNARNQELEAARIHYVEFETRLYAAHPELRVHRGRAAPITIAEVGSGLLASDSALLTYLVGPDVTNLLVLTKDPQEAGSIHHGSASVAAPTTKVILTRYCIPIKRSDLTDRCDRLVSLLSDPNHPFKRDAMELYDLILRPAEAQLQGKQLLYVSPDGPLWRIPFQALKTATGRYVIEDRSIAYVPSLTVLRGMVVSRARRHIAAKSKAIIAFGDPLFRSKGIPSIGATRTDLQPLPDSAQEVNEIQRLYAGRCAAYVGADAREDRLKRECGQYGIIHIASHGLLDDKNPMYSKVVLADAEPAKSSGEDGFLETWEMMSLNLNAELVVLSACKTGRGHIGAGEGVVGMAWALAIAGCPSTVVSQWEVRSDSTRDLMLAFHRALISASDGGSSGPVKAGALRQAALQMLKRPGFSHPFHWAAFSLIGDAE